MTHAAPDELTLIDTGGVVVTTRAISFVGSQFTRTTEFSKIVDSERRGRQILIAPSNAAKVHILGFESEAESFLAFVLLWSGSEGLSRTLKSAPLGERHRDPLATATELALQILADELVEKRNAIRDLESALALVERLSAVPFPIPAPRPSLLDRMGEDALVPFDAVPAGALTASASPRLLKVAILLSFFGGLSGLDRFYLGYWREGLIKFATAGGFGFLWLRDLRLLVTGRLPDAQGRPLSGALELPGDAHILNRALRHASRPRSSSHGTNTSR